MGSCVGKKNNQEQYIESGQKIGLQLTGPPILLTRKETDEAEKQGLNVNGKDERDALKETMMVKRDKKEDIESKGKTVVLRSGEMSRRNETDCKIDEKVQQLLKKDRMMSAIFQKVRERLRN